MICFVRKIFLAGTCIVLREVLVANKPDEQRYGRLECWV
jgi:hypothetical protein